MTPSKYLLQHQIRLLMQLSTKRSIASHCLIQRHIKRWPSKGTTFASTRLKIEQPFTWCLTRTYASKKTKGNKKDSDSKVKGSKHFHRQELAERDYEDIVNLEEMKEWMAEEIETLKQDYIKNLSLRTSPGVFDNLVIKTKDGKFPLNQIGQVAAKNPHLVIINLAASPQHLPDVMTALNKSGMDINPQPDGNMIAVPIPKVTREHREKLAKNARVLCQRTKEKCSKIYIRYCQDVKAAEGVSADLLWNIEQMLLDELHIYEEEADHICKIKQQEVLGETGQSK